MAIEIREIVIRANITEPVAQKNNVQQPNRKALVDECVKRVMSLIKNRSIR